MRFLYWEFYIGNPCRAEKATEKVRGEGVVVSVYSW